MNEREKNIMKEVLKEHLTIERDSKGGVAIYFADEVVCELKDKKVKKK